MFRKKTIHMFEYVLSCDKLTYLKETKGYSIKKKTYWALITKNVKSYQDLPRWTFYLPKASLATSCPPIKFRHFEILLLSKLAEVMTLLPSAF